MIEIIKAMGVGFICGFAFTFLKLPLPAPPVLAGIMGIFGIYLGFVVCTFFFGKPQ